MKLPAKTPIVRLKAKTVTPKMATFVVDHPPAIFAIQMLAKSCAQPSEG